MIDQQIALEEKTMKRTTMESMLERFDSEEGKVFFSEMASMVSDGIAAYHDGVKRKRSPFFKLTTDFTHEELAYLALKVTVAELRSSGTAANVVDVAGTLGNHILKDSDRAEDIHSTDPEVIKSKVVAGIVLLDIVITALPGLFTAVNERESKSKTRWKVRQTDEFHKLCNNHEELLSFITKKNHPMVCQPEDWTDVRTGGYLTDLARRQTPLVKKKPFHELPGGIVLSSINHLQKTPFQVNTEIFELCKELESLRPSKLKKMFPKDPGKFTEPCPLSKEQSEWIWEKKEVPRYGKRGQLLKKPGEVYVHDEDEHKELRREYGKWRSRKEANTAKREKHKSLKTSVSDMISIVTEMLAYPEMWWPYQVDRRSRVYPAALSGIKLQGSDFEKAVVKFSVGLSLESEDGVYALKKTLCNHWGEDSGNGVKTDKLTRSEAEKWIDKQSDWIVKCAEAPLENIEWMGADKPLQFLAAAIEWKGWVEHWAKYGDYEFISYLPDPNDASCSGAQILSAMTRDQVGALHTNLLDRPVQDLYMAVADEVSRLLLSLFRDEEYGTMAQDWLGYSDFISGIEQIIAGEGHDIIGDESQERVQLLSKKGLSPDEILMQMYGETEGCFTKVERYRMSMIIRNLVKKPVMVKFYSGTRYGNIEHCREFITDKGWEGKFRCEKVSHAAKDMGGWIYDSIDEVIKGAGIVMKWFIHVAEVLGKYNKPLIWDTPAGFTARMSKPALTDVRPKVMFQGAERKFTVNVPEYIEQEDGTKVLKLDARKMASGVAPDIVHSLDASLIMLVTERCRKEGIDNLWMIHDSLGAHMRYTVKFNRIIREEFRNMFQEDILSRMYEKFKQQLDEEVQDELMSPWEFGIKMGTYNLDEILESEHCFK